jgi:hypothetical protein
VAYHEAGHAVAYLWYGQMVVHVTILPTPEMRVAGHCSDPLATGTRLTMDEGRRVVAGLTLSAYKAHILALYAGRAAEALLSGERDARRAFRGLTGDQSDRQRAAEMIAALWPAFGELRRRERRYRRLALWFVWRYRARIERVAEALLRFGSLSGIEAALVVNEGSDAIAEHRRIWAGCDGGLWAEWSAALDQLRAEDVVRPSAPTWHLLAGAIVGIALAVAVGALAFRYYVPGAGLLLLFISQLFRTPEREAGTPPPPRPQP